MVRGAREAGVNTQAISGEERGKMVECDRSEELMWDRIDVGAFVHLAWIMDDLDE